MTPNHVSFVLENMPLTKHIIKHIIQLSYIIHSHDICMTLLIIIMS